jgi:UPF0755 protein
MKRNILIATACATFVLLAGGVVAGGVLWQRLYEPYRGYVVSERFVIVSSGSGTAAIGRQLIEAGVVSDDFLFRAALWWTNGARSLQAGEYRFTQPTAPVHVVERLMRGDVHQRPLSFPEGLTVAEMARLFEARGFGSAEGFLVAAGNISLVVDFDTEATDLEGYLFPDTYQLRRDTPPATLIALMVTEFREAYPESLRQRAEAQGFTTRQIVTLASLVEKETGQADERPLVAAVYRNRLERRMLMQADPTIVYALQRAGVYDGNIQRQDLEFDSPYNTYRYPGLPPGPIASPGIDSLRAVIDPADVPFLYFVSRNDGSHAFARTLAEHNRNVREFQIDFFRRQ